MTKRDEWERWRKENPLLQLANAEGQTQTATASMLGVSPTTLHRWTNGLARPAQGNMTLIADMFGEDEAILDRAWTQWEKKRP